MEGRREAYYFNSAMKSGDSDKYNIHPLFQIQRLIIFILCLMLCANIFVAFSIGLSMISCFSYIHNGTYYNVRNNLDKTVYPLRWKDDSLTSHASFEMHYGERLLMFILGCGIYITTIIISIYFNVITV